MGGTNSRGIVGIGLTHRFGINGHGELKNQVSRLDTRDLHLAERSTETEEGEIDQVPESRK